MFNNNIQIISLYLPTDILYKHDCLNIYAECTRFAFLYTNVGLKIRIRTLFYCRLISNTSKHSFLRFFNSATVP